MTVSDFIFDFLSKKGANKIFMITGGQAMFLDDAVGRNKKIKYICTHHEQAAGMAAEAYGRITGNLGVALVTAGPAAINVLNGVVGGWTDSSPMMVISGQSPLSYVQYQQNHKIRQHGIQGINIKPIVEKITKYFITVDDPALIQYYMQKAYYFATSGRRGPVWIDVPLDIQNMIVTDKFLKEFIPGDEIFDENTDATLKSDVSEVLRLLVKAKRPIILAGQGVRSSGAIDAFGKLIKKIPMPILTSRLGIDIIQSDHPLYIGRPGNYGERAAHYAIQNSDVLLVLGSRLASALVGHNPKEFGRNAKIIVVDIDKEELEKPGVKIYIKINADVKNVINEMLRQAKHVHVPNVKSWIQTCNDWKKRYPVVLPEYKKEKPINSYYFTNILSELASKNDMVLVDTGSCFHIACQTWKIKKGQRFLTTGGISSMGYWAAGMGACVANDYKNTIVITGDGSLQMNIQELATIKHNKLPIKIIIFNNNGYSLIRQTQKNFMEGRLIGEGPKTGVWCPDSLKIAKAYGIKGVRISKIEGLERKIQKVLDYPGPVICDVMTPPWQLIIPRTASTKNEEGKLIPKPYEDMFPFLPREELLSNLAISEHK